MLLFIGFYEDLRTTINGLRFQGKNEPSQKPQIVNHYTYILFSFSEFY